MPKSTPISFILTSALLVNVIAFTLLPIVSETLTTSIEAQSSDVDCTVTVNRVQVNPGESFNVTVDFSDGNPHQFTYNLGLFSSGVVTPTINPFTFTAIAPNTIMRNITIIPAVGGDHNGCRTDVANTIDGPSNECNFDTEPSNLQNLDNTDGRLEIKVLVTDGPTGTYKATITKGDSSQVVEEVDSQGRPSFDFQVDAPDERGVFKIDVTGIRADNGQRLDCNTVDGLLFRQISIQSGQSPGVGRDTSADTTGDLPENVRKVVDFFLTFGIGIAGGVAFLLLVYGSFKLVFSAGDPKAVGEAREVITAAIIGLLVIVFSVFLLRLIGISILGLPI